MRGHILKPKTTKLNHRFNEMTATTEMTQVKLPKQPKWPGRAKQNHQNNRKYPLESLKAYH